MIAAIKDFFAQVIAPDARGADGPSEHALQLATAALLVEMMRADNSVSQVERAATEAALQRRFGLSEGELETLVALAEEEAREAADLYQFTSLINRGFNAGQKARLVEYLWQVAFADGHLDAHEQHLIGKVADLLHVPHTEYIAAKLRAREAGKA